MAVSAAEEAGKILAYLERKYAHEFEITGRIGQSWGMTGSRWGAKPKSGGNGEVFTVTENPDSGYGYSDSYYSVCVLPEYAKFISALADGKFARCKVFAALDMKSPNPDGLTRDVPVADIYKFTTGEASFRSLITLWFPASETDDKDIAGRAEDFCHGLADAKLSALVRVLRVSDSVFDGAGASPPEYTPAHGGCAAYLVDAAYRVVPVAAPATAAPERQTGGLDAGRLERLCSLVYLDGLLLHQCLGSLGAIVACMLADGCRESRVNGKWPCLMSADEWNAVLRGILPDPSLCSLRVAKYVDVSELTPPGGDVLPGHRAVCFTDDYQGAYIIFRGTCGDEEWRDNADGMTCADTVQQKASAEFVAAVANDKTLGVKTITVAGHSKGGNKAQYVTVVTDYADRCVSIDGQGFSAEFFEKYNDRIAAKKQRIRLLAERRDFVNSLGRYMGKTAFYSGRRGDKTSGRPYGDPLPYFHCPDALRASTGDFGETCDSGTIPRTINELALYLLESEKYRSVRKTVADNIVCLMMQSKTNADETAEAVKNLILVFLDITAHSSLFDDGIVDVVYNESDVLLATIEAAAQSGGKTGGDGQNLRKLVISKLADALIKHDEYRVCLGKVLIKLSRLIKKIMVDMRADPAISDYLRAFVCELLEHFAARISNKLIKAFVGDVVFKWRAADITGAGQGVNALEEAIGRWDRKIFL